MNGWYHRCWVALLAVVGTLGVSGFAPAQSDTAPMARKPPAPGSPLSTAMEGQQRVLAELSRILQEEKATLSEGMIRSELEALLKAHNRQIEGIRDLGKRTLGRKEDELTDQDKADRDKLGVDQDEYTQRFRRLEKSVGIKAEAQPDSPFAQLVRLAGEVRLKDKMEEASSLLRANQLGKGLGVTREVVAGLGRMVAILGGESPDGVGDEAKAGAEQSPLAGSAQATGLSTLAWAGPQADALGKIARAIRKLNELVERQRTVTNHVKAPNLAEATAGELTAAERQIREEALKVAEDLALLDPQVEQSIRSAGTSIDEVMTLLGKRPPGNAGVPAQQATDHLVVAVDRLTRLWNDILARLKAYALALPPQVGAASASAGGTGMSAAEIEKLERLVFRMLRATAGLTDAIGRQTHVVASVRALSLDGSWGQLAAEQVAVAKHVQEEVVAMNVPQSELPGKLREQLTVQYSAEVVLKEAGDRFERTRAALEGRLKPEAAKRAQEGVELLEDALPPMMNVLQALLGQLAPPGASVLARGSGGTTVAGNSSEPVAPAFGLQPQQLEAVHRAFSGAFPQRYDEAIKTYYQAITREDVESSARGN